MYPDEARPHVSCYVSVACADRTAAEAVALGGALLLEPFAVEDLGRMATVQDPTGAVLSIWQPGTFRGKTAPTDVPGAPAWYELITPDVSAARQFYTQFFSWSGSAIDPQGEGCIFAKDSGQPSQPPAGFTPSPWPVCRQGSGVWAMPCRTVWPRRPRRHTSAPGCWASTSSAAMAADGRSLDSLIVEGEQGAHDFLTTRRAIRATSARRHPAADHG